MNLHDRNEMFERLTWKGWLIGIGTVAFLSLGLPFLLWFLFGITFAF